MVEEPSREETVELKVLGAKKKARGQQVDLFAATLDEAERRTSDPTKQKSLQEIRQKVLPELSETD
ncbi:hypothetical protein C241_15773 [Bradyrhizobium lupini HPC(L)]|uniref:Uncharacterized protein n=1 Tax=Bradyrhizobium lupini HPC(L) TaxID=1229491 RepID=A0ABP2RP26_RHILU|nr:hypothetical protein C241_15773 [Bradyrhizobium lupini HPC(L)]